MSSVKVERALLKRMQWVLAIAVLLGLLPEGVAAAQDASVKPDSGVNPVIQPGDLVRLKIWREPDLSGDYRVDENGVATFPKIGSLPVSRLSTHSLKSLLVSTYGRYLRNPSVEVTFLRRVNVLGAVKNPGLYDADPTITVADIVAMAGGVNPDGNPDRIELVRQGRPLSVRLSQHSLLARSPIRSGDQLLVQQRSWLSRNTTIVGAGISAMALVIIAFIRP
jgi:protein involved in polysaccharide export with SLBB domain